MVRQHPGQRRGEAGGVVRRPHVDHGDLPQPREEGPHGRDLKEGLVAGAHQHKVPGIRPGQILGPDGARRAGADAGDVGGIQNPDGHSRFRAVHGDEPHQIRQAPVPVGLKPGDGLVSIQLCLGEVAGFDVHVRVAGVKLIKGSGPHYRLPIALLPVHLLHAVDDRLHLRDPDHILPAQNSNVRHRNGSFLDEWRPETEMGIEPHSSALQQP